MYNAAKNRASTIEIIKFLSEKGDYKQIDDGLLGACEVSNLEFIKYFAGLPNINVNCKDDDGNSPVLLLCADDNADNEKLEFLCSLKPELNVRGRRERTPLQVLLENEQVTVGLVETLLKNGADVRLTGENEKGMLYYAAYGKHSSLELVKLLLEHGAKDYDDGLVGACSSAKPNLAIIKLLVEKGGNPHVNDAARKNLLHLLCASDGVNESILEYLFEIGVSTEEKEEWEGNNPLHVLCENQNCLSKSRE